MSERLARWGIVLVVFSALLFGFLLPGRPAPVVDPLTIPGDPPYVTCPVAIAGSGFESTVGVVAGTDTIGTLSGVGVDTPGEDFAISGGEGLVFDVGSVAELGITPVLVERRSEGDLGAAVLARAGAAVAVAGCQPAQSGPVALLGLATSEGEESNIVLANPFAVEASGRLVGSSEFGLDIVAQLEAVRVPANSTLTLPLGQLMAGRQQLGFTLYTDAGALVAGMTRSGGDIAASEAIPGAQQWFVPLPAFGVDGQIVVRNLASVEAAYRIDAFDPEGVIEGVDTGAVPPNTEFWFNLEDLGASGGYLITADEPVAVATVYTGEATRIVSTASPTATVAWLIPVSSSAPDSQTAVWILNPEEGGVTVEVTVFGGATAEFEVPPGSTLGQIIPFNGRAGLITASGEVAVFHGVLSDGGAASMTLAYPLE